MKKLLLLILITTLYACDNNNNSTKERSTLDGYGVVTLIKNTRSGTLIRVKFKTIYNTQAPQYVFDGERTNRVTQNIDFISNENYSIGDTVLFNNISK